MSGPTGEIALLLARAEKLVAQRVAAALERKGLSLAAWRVLTLLADGRGHPMTEVAEFSMLPPGSLTRLVDQLVEDNLVYRRIDPADRRRIRVLLTRRGHDVRAQVDDQIEASVPELHVADLAAKLSELIAMLESTRPATVLPRSR